MAEEKGAPAQPLEPKDIATEAADLLAGELRRNMREPFKRALQRMLQFRPTEDALRKFAEKSPDRWALAVSTLAGLAGFEKGVTVNVRVKNVSEMSDRELLEELSRGVRDIGEVVPQVVAQGTDGEGGVGTPALPAPKEKVTE